MIFPRPRASVFQRLLKCQADAVQAVAIDELARDVAYTNFVGGLADIER